MKGEVDASNLLPPDHLSVNYEILYPFDKVTINSLNEDQRLFIDVKVGHKTVACLIDTGAAVSVIDQKQLQHIFEYCRFINVKPPKIQAATGHLFKTLGVVVVPLRIEGKEVKHPFIVVDHLKSKVIIGDDFLNRNLADISYTERKITFRDQKFIEEIEVRNKQEIKILPYSAQKIKVKTNTQKANKLGIIYNSQAYLISEALLQLDQRGNADILIFNTSNVDLTVPRDMVVGHFQETSTSAVKTIEEVVRAARQEGQGRLLSTEKKEFIKKNAIIGGSTQFKHKCVNLLLQYHKVVSVDKYDIGKTEMFPHEIHLKDNVPIHTKQFRIPWAHRQFLDDFVDELLKKGCIQSSRSPFNSPIFCVQKPHNQGLRIVQDFRNLNMHTLPDKYSFREVTECIDMIGKRNSKYFSTIDLTSGFWQQKLHPDSMPRTAFTLPGRGRFEWVRMPMGLQGSPSSFARLMDHVMMGLDGTITYLDDVLCHSSSEQQHLQDLEKCLKRIQHFNLKINIKKCAFNIEEVPYLGFTLTRKGIRPGKEKTKAVEQFPEPNSIRQIREFTGLTNYFRKMIPNYAQMAGHLTKLTSKQTAWEGGPLPPIAKEAFNKLKQHLISAPILAYPQLNRPFLLATDASTGDANNPGGLGAVLSQMHDDGSEKVVAYASRSLRPHEKNYSAFLLEMAAASWGIDHFDVYLKGKPFTLITDHKPLVALNNTHKKTLNRLQEQMNEYSFVLRYREGSKNGPPDALSRNPVEVIETEMPNLGLDWADLVRAQRSDIWCQLILLFLKKGVLPQDPKSELFIKQFAKRVVIFKDVLYFTIPDQYGQLRPCLWIPKMYQPMMLKAAHCHPFAGHEGKDKTLARLQRKYWWPKQYAHVQSFVEQCPVCQRSKDPPYSSRDHAPMQRTDIPSAPHQKCHIDLMGPLRTSEKGNKYIMVMTDAFSKYTVLAAIPDKKAETVAQTLFEKWIAVFSCPKILVSDNGKEMVNNIMKILCEKFQIKHRKTASYHPQSNSPAESFNRTIIKYMRTTLDNNTLDWESHLPAIMIAYNTRVHKAIATTPFFLTFCMDPNLPYFDLDQSKPSFNDDVATLAYERSRAAWRKTGFFLKQASEKQLLNAEQNTKERQLKVGQKVLVKLPFTTPGENIKFKQPWQDNFYIVAKAGPVTYLVKNQNTNRQSLMHIDRLKAKLPTEFVKWNSLTQRLKNKMNFVIGDDQDEEGVLYLGYNKNGFQIPAELPEPQTTRDSSGNRPQLDVQSDGAQHSNTYDEERRNNAPTRSRSRTVDNDGRQPTVTTAAPDRNGEQSSQFASSRKGIGRSQSPIRTSTQQAQSSSSQFDSPQEKLGHVQPRLSESDGPAANTRSRNRLPDETFPWTKYLAKKRHKKAGSLPISEVQISSQSAQKAKSDAKSSAKAKPTAEVTSFSQSKTSKERSKTSNVNKNQTQQSTSAITKPRQSVPTTENNEDQDQTTDTDDEVFRETEGPSEVAAGATGNQRPSVQQQLYKRHIEQLELQQRQRQQWKTLEEQFGLRVVPQKGNFGQSQPRPKHNSL